MTLIPGALRVGPKQHWFELPTDQESRVWRVRLNYKAFAAAAVTGDIDYPFPAGVMVEKAFISLIQLFTGGGSSTATLSIGLTTAIGTYLAATNVFSGSVNGAITLGAGAGIGTFVGGTATPSVGATVRLRFTGDVNTNLFTQGKADVYMQLRAFSVRAS